MAKKKKEEVVEQTTDQPKVDDKVEKLTIKEKPTMKKMGQESNEPIKVDLSKPPKKETDAVQEPEANASDATVGESEDSKSSEKVVEEVRDTKEEPVQDETTPVVEEITSTQEDEKTVETDDIEESVEEVEESTDTVPENIQKLMDFMENTGGDLNDYIKLNRDYSNVDDQDLLFEHYKQTKPHLTNEEINFLMEDQFSYDEETDDERDIKRKKLALKEQVASAKTQLEENKSKYYKDIKAGSKLTQEQQKAVDFFNRYNEESKATQKTVKTNSDIFTQKTNNVFNDNFKGFEYNVGDKKYRFNVNNAEEVKNTQSDISNFTKKFLDKNSALKDAKGYHKSLYTAMNADAVAKHFYEQGKADAMKDSVAKAKNVDMNPRQSHGTIDAGGVKVRVLGNDANDFKFKINKNK